MLTKKDILNNLRKLSQELKPILGDKKLGIILVGGANIILLHNPKGHRVTYDIDVLSTGLEKLPRGIGNLFGKYFLHIQPEIFFLCHPDWDKNLKQVMEFDNLVIYAPCEYDLAISKIARGYDKDIKDILDSELIEKLDFSKLKAKYFEAIEYWWGRHEEYKANWQRFEEEYRKKISSQKDKHFIR